MTTLPSGEGAAVPANDNVRVVRIGDATLYHADCRDVLRGLPDNSIDSVVTDPPYALVSIQKRFGKPGSAAVKIDDPSKSGCIKAAYARASAGFMGKQWDTGEVAFSEEFWAEVLRVLKPGGHVVAFSGTRTYHRMAVAIEDAGFEIRDQCKWMHEDDSERDAFLASLNDEQRAQFVKLFEEHGAGQLSWDYGQGFPKSHNISRNLDGTRCACTGCEAAEPILQHDMRPVRNADVQTTEYPGEERGEVLLASVSEQGASAAERRQLSDNDGGGQSSVEGRRNTEASKGKLRVSKIREVPAPLAVDVEAGRLHNGASEGNGGVGGQTIEANRGGASCGSQSTEQSTVEPRVMAGQSKPQDGGAWANCGRCGKPIIPDGLGTSLKPAWEPICLARKPLVGTVAENVLKHGTGALNIDGCRVELGGDETPYNYPNGRGGEGWHGRESLSSNLGVPLAGNAQGRWPANIVHDGSDEVLAAFPDGGAHGGKGKFVQHAWAGREATEQDIKRSTGSAARFFYCAKASRKDRDEGLEHLPKQAGGMVSNTSGQHITRRDEGYKPEPRANTHPTVKPTDLMRWLCRLVTPPGGLVLDPFMGSGSTGKAALLEGFRFIGCEREDEYIPIAEARIAAALRRTANDNQPVAAPDAVAANSNQPDLFGSAA